MSTSPVCPPEARPVLALVAAVARNGTVGRDNSLPWHLPEDLKHFRRITAGAPVIMGRKTWDSLPERFRPLPGRHNIVVTRQADWHAPGATPVHSLDAALAAAAVGAVQRVFVIGGAALYAEALPAADELVLTEIDADFQGDACFPDWPREAFQAVSRTTQAAEPPYDFSISFVTYRRRLT